MTSMRRRRRSPSRSWSPPCCGRRTSTTWSATSRSQQHGIPQRSQTQPQQTAPDPAADIVSGMFKTDAEPPAQQEPPERAQTKGCSRATGGRRRATARTADAGTGDDHRTADGKLYDTVAREYVERPPAQGRDARAGPGLHRPAGGPVLQQGRPASTWSGPESAPPRLTVEEPPKRRLRKPCSAKPEGKRGT